MLKSRLLNAIKSPFAKRDQAPEVDPQLADGMAMLDQAEATIRAQFPDGDMPQEAQDDLAKLGQMRAMTQTAVDADANGDLDTLMSVAAQVKQAAPASEADEPELTAEEAKFFAAIDDADLPQITTALEVMNVNARYGPHGLTPLVHAVTAEHVSIPVILTLLEAGAETDAPTPLGGNALTAMALGHFDTLSSTEVLELAKAFEALGAAVDTPDDHALSPLHRAILRQNAPVLEALLRLGADPSAVVDDAAMPDFLAGMSPLHAAVMDPELVTILLSYGADSTATDSMGQTPAAYAADMLRDGLDDDEAADVTRTLNLLQTAQAA